MPEPAAPRSRLGSWRGRGLAGPVPPGPLGRVVSAARSLAVALLLCARDHVGDRAAALSYATLLALLPALALGFVAMSYAGIPETTVRAVRAELLDYLLPAAAATAVASLETAIDALAALSHTLGIAGTVLLLLCVRGLEGSLGRSFRRIWGSSGLAHRFRRSVFFWIVCLAMPVVFGLSVRAESYVVNLGGTGPLVHRLAALAAGFMVILVVYLTFPETPTRLAPAAAGALAAALLWEALKVGFASYVRYAIVTRSLLAGLGSVPLLLIWLYLSWTALLLGAELHAALQDPGRSLQRVGLGPRRLAGDSLARDDGQGYDNGP